MTNNSKVTKIVSGLIGLATVFSMFVGVTASAQTTGSAALMAQIQALQAQLNAMSGTSASMSYTFSANLSLGSKGQDVWNLQKALNSWDGTHVAVTGAGSPGNETSTFGPATKKAVMKFQAKFGISQTGTVGPITRAKLNSLMSTVVVTPGQPGVPPVVVSGPVGVSLSSDNPAAGYIINGQATADLAHFTFTGNGMVNSVTLTRSGISDQNTLQNLYLFDGNTRITDGYSFNSNSQIVINNLNIAVNGSHTISVRADIASAAATTASTLAIGLTGFSSGTNVNTVNVWGNTFNVSVGNAATASIGTQTVSPGCSTTCPTVNAGTTAYTFWSAPLQINTRSVWLKTANFRMVGSAPSDALSNIMLYVDGISTGKIAVVSSINGSNYASFDFTSNPISLPTGSHTIDVRADVQKGSNRNVQFSVQQASDLTITDPQVGVNIAVTNLGSTSYVANTAGQITINSGSATVVVDPTFQQLTNVTGGATNVVLGRFKVHAYGEDVKVSSLSVTPTVSGSSSNGSLQNVTLYFNGSQVGSQVASSTGAQTFNLGSQMILPAGTDSWIEVRADLRDSAGANYSSGTVTVALNGGSSNAQGQNSQNTVSFPGTTITTTALTIQTGLLSVAKNPSYTDQVVAPNTAGVKIGSYVLQNQSSSESVRITSMIVALGGTASTTNFAALRLSETSGSAGIPVQPAASSTFSTNFTLAPGETKIIDVLADTSNQSATVITTVTVTSIGVSSNVSTTQSATAQTITLASGTVTANPTLLSNSTVSQFIAAKGGLTDGTLASYKVVAASGAVTIRELKYTVAASSTATSVKIGGVSAPFVNGLAYLTGLNIAVPQGGSGTSLDTYVSYPDVGTTGISSNSTSTIALNYIKYSTGNSTTATTTSINANAMLLVGSKPTVTAAKPSATLASTSTIEAIDVTVAADARGSVTLVSLPITVSFNSALASSTATNNITVKDENNQNIPVSNTAFGATSGGTTKITFTTPYEITPSQPKTFKIYVTTATVTGTGVNGASMSTSLATGSQFVWQDTAGGSTTNLGGTDFLPSYPNTFTSTIYN